MTRTAVVYFHRAVDGRVLYVGMTGDLAKRTRTHEMHSSWWPDVDLVTHVGPFDRHEAAHVERAAIAEHQPEFNYKHTAREFIDFALSKGVTVEQLRTAGWSA